MYTFVKQCVCVCCYVDKKGVCCVCCVVAYYFAHPRSYFRGKSGSINVAIAI